MESTQLRERIDSFPRWHYEFDLAGVKTPIFDPGHANRHTQRYAYFFQPLVDMLGGSLAGKRVLDLGCNAGYWSLRAIENGCDYVLGVDGRQMHIDQANLVFETKQIERHQYDFQCNNFFDLDYDRIGIFDVVLCLGIFYHINKHFNLLELISAVNSDVLVIDTSLSTLPGSLLEVRWDSLDEPRDALDYELIMWPTQSAVVDMVQQVGYRAVSLKPDFTDYEGSIDYKVGARRAFICAKITDLSSLATSVAVEKETLASRRPFDGVSGWDLARELMARAVNKIGLGDRT
jgi:SAM-dependent methyltransferase